MKTPHDIAIERIRELRKRHGWTQQELADVLNRLGVRTDRAAIAKVETGQRGLSLNELFQYAQALNVAPVHLVASPDSNEPVSLGPDMECTPAEMRAWVRGQLPLFQDERVYFSEVPKGELRVLGWASDESHEAELRAEIAEQEAWLDRRRRFDDPLGVLDQGRDYIAAMRRDLGRLTAAKADKS